MIKEIVNKAYTFAEEKHKGQMRKYSDIPYFTHPKFVARVLEKLTDDPDIVAAGLLHDVIEDTDTTYREIFDNFNRRVYSLVFELTNKDEEKYGRKTVDYLHWKFRNFSSDAFLIKLADRYHNVMFLNIDYGITNTKEIKGFIKYYVRQTKTIMHNIENELHSCLTNEQGFLIDSIRSILFMTDKFM